MISGRFTGKTVLVAGGTGGLGRAVSLQFINEGAAVAVTYVVQEEFDALAQAVGANRSRLAGHHVDVTDEAAVRRVIDDLAAQGRLDALVNAVGGYAGGSKLWEFDATVLDRMLALNLRSAHALLRAVVPVMVRQGDGAIVNVAARAAYDHPAGAAAYTASKAALLALAGSLAAEVKGTGVRVNSIVPSIIDTPPNRSAMPKADFSKWPKPEELASVVLFLCSDESRIVHGAAIPVYGNR